MRTPYDSITIEPHFTPETVKAIDAYHDTRAAFYSAMHTAEQTAIDAVNAGLVAAKKAQANPTRSAEAIRKELAKANHIRDAAAIAEVGLLHLLEQVEPLARADWMEEHHRRREAAKAREGELHALADQQGYPVKSVSRQSLVVQDDRRRGLDAAANAARSKANESLITEEVKQRHDQAVSELMERFKV